MCLDTITKSFKKSDHVKGVGYKVFQDSHGELAGDFTSSKERTTGHWLHERNFRITGMSGHLLHISWGPQSYPMGWHIFYSYSTARRYAKKENGQTRYYITKKVLYRDARTVGEQKHRKIIVAKEIFILGK